MTHVIPIQCNAYLHHSYLAQCTIYYFSSVEALNMDLARFNSILFQFIDQQNIYFFGN